MIKIKIKRSMKYFFIPLVFGLFLGSVLLVNDNSAYGLSCEISNMTNHFASTDVVFLGKALSKDYHQNPRHEDRYDAVTLFSVIEPFKGIHQKTVNVTSSEWLWGVNFTENNEYVVFAMYDEGKLEHALCTPTHLASESDLEQIREVSQNYILSPIAQMEFGVDPKDVQCKKSLILMAKSSDGSPACVRPESREVLIKRGWTNIALPKIDFDSPDRIEREVGYLGLMMLLPHVEQNETVVIALEGRPNLVRYMVDYYDIETLSSKITPDDSFLSIFGKMTKTNLQKFFEENKINHFLKHGLSLYSVGSFTNDTGTYGPFNEFLTGKEGEKIGKILQTYENYRLNMTDIDWRKIVKWPTGEISDEYYFEMISNDSTHNRTPGGSISPDRTVYPVPWETRSPLKQFKDGIDPKVIHCNEGLILIQRYDGFPACVMQETKQKLIERGWSKTNETHHNIVLTNSFPNIKDRDIRITIGQIQNQDGSLSVRVLEKTTRSEPSDSIMFQKIVVSSTRTLTKNDGFFSVSAQGGKALSENYSPEPTLQSLYAGNEKERISVYFPVEIPLGASAKDDLIVFNYSLPYILPDFGKTYSFSVVSLAPVEIKLPINAKIIDNDVRVHNGFWLFDKTDEGQLSYKTDEYLLFYGYDNPSISIKNVVTYDIKFELEK